MRPNKLYLMRIIQLRGCSVKVISERRTTYKEYSQITEASADRLERYTERHPTAVVGILANGLEIRIS